MNDNNLYIDFKLSKSKINEYLKKELLSIFPKKINTQGLTLDIQLLEDKNISISGKEKSILAQIPLSFTFFKPAGLFSIEGEGAIMMYLQMDIDIDNQLMLVTQSSLVKHEWIKEPIIHVGQLNLPIETISDCIISFLKDDVLENLDKKISQDVHLSDSIQAAFKQFGTNYPISKKPNLYFNTQLLQIQASTLEEEHEDLKLGIWIELMGKISDDAILFESVMDPRFYWVEKIDEQHLQTVDIQLSYQGLAKMLMTFVNGQTLGGKNFELESVHIRNTSILEIKANLISPIKGILTITGIPVFNKVDQKLDIENLSIHIDAQNIIYKLSSPIIERIVASKIETMLPFSILPIIEPLLGKIPDFKVLDNLVHIIPKVSNIVIDQIVFGQIDLIANVHLQGAKVDIIV